MNTEPLPGTSKTVRGWQVLAASAAVIIAGAWLVLWWMPHILGEPALHDWSIVLLAQVRAAGLDQPAVLAEALRRALWWGAGMLLLLLIAATALFQQTYRERPKRREEQNLLAQYKTIFNNAMIGIVYLKQRRVVSCNRRLEEIFGYAPGELIGQSTALFFASQAAYEAIGEDAYRVLAGNCSYNTEDIFRRKDGSTFPGALNSCIIDPEHPNDGSIWIYADISERCNAEKRAHQLLQAVEQSPLSVVITDRMGMIEYVNPRFSTLTGYAAEEVLGRHLGAFRTDASPADPERAPWASILAGAEWSGERRSQRKQGDGYWEEMTIAPILEAGGEVSHFVAIMEDITPRKTIKQQLEAQKDNLEALVDQRTSELSTALEAARLADQSKDAFLANMSHELRTPLNAVIGMANLARSTATEAQQQNYLDKIITSGKHLNRIINDLLDLSKISAGHLEFEQIPFSVRKLIERCHEVMELRATNKGLTLSEQIDPEIPDTLIGDPVRIDQILMNLIGNAIKFTQQGGIQLDVRLSSRDERQVCLTMAVEDSGIGIRPEDMVHLFEPFVQTDASINRKYGGTGLGLAISRRLTRMMGGDIELSSQQGVGTTFTVSLRLGLGQPGDLQAADAAHEGGACEALPVAYDNVRILVVEDQPLNREIVDALLASVSICSDMAENGQVALEILTKAGPAAFDLVLMDVQMPVMDGLTATRLIRAKPGFSTLPIIGLSAHTMAHERKISAEAGMNDHIGKPFDNSSFYRTLARWIPVKRQKHPKTPVAPCLAAPVPASPLPPVTPEPRPGDLRALPGLDLVKTIARFNGREDRYRHWLIDFINTADEAPEPIRQEIAHGRPQQAAQVAHLLKGRFGMLGMVDLHARASELEQRLRQEAPADELVDALQQAIEQMRADLSTVLLPPDQPALPEPDRTTRRLEHLSWTERFSVGRPEFDAQHKKLIEMINELADCQRLSVDSPGTAQLLQAKQTFHQVLTEMFDYTQLHFNVEEAYLQAIGYPQSQAHQQEHASFIEKLAALSLAAAEDDLDMAGVHHYLKGWLFGHILQSDMAYRQFAETAGHLNPTARAT